MPGDRGSRRGAALAFATIVAGTGVARAEPPPVTAIDPAKVQGIERPAVEPGDAQRDIASALLFLPREMVRLMFLAGGVSAGLIRDEQVVPRVGELLSPSPGNVSLIPSLFLDTRRRTSVGAQMLASGRESGTRLAFGFGGVHDLLGEARVRFGFAKPIPFVLSIEGLSDTRSSLGYVGVGQEPEKDKRNIYLPGVAAREAHYYEQRVRGIASLGARVAPDWEIFISASMTKSRVENTPGDDTATISRIFRPGTVVGAPVYSARCPVMESPLPCPAESRIVYTELALRLDTRPTSARPSAGVLVEAYAGLARGTGDDPSQFYRIGGRAAGFFPVLRTTNILSPKIALDGMLVPGGAAEPPFTALTSQPDFRGLDNRIDRVSVVASLDYRYSIVRYLGARFFVDVAVVGPDFGAVFDAPKRVAVGFGLDVFSNAALLAQFTAAFSSEGARASLTFGVPEQFGDRQHRH
jgi:hypothetical protein